MARARAVLLSALVRAALVIAFLTGERQASEVDDYVDESRSTRRTARASALVGMSSGPQLLRQMPIRKTFRFRASGTGTAISGTLTLAPNDLVWQPSRPWAISGAAGISVRWAKVTMIEFIPRKGRGTIMSVSVDDGSRLWFLVHQKSELQRFIRGSGALCEDA
jgi:hypothetical protein